MKTMPEDAMTKVNYDLFPELATTLFYFIERLHDNLVKQGVEQVYFLSREGQPLMRMFEMYRERKGGGITSRYLEVSRRSTLLPSLVSLGEENFETLFRQYRRISLFEFLSSLGLEAHASSIAQALGLPKGAEAIREEDFPSSPTFTALKTLALFRSLYDSERITRRSAFIAYLTRLSGGIIPARMFIVDVGWKGTIQDNLFAMLCRDGDTPVRHVTGYYIGLVAEGAASSTNNKLGLLFSSVGAPSPKFRVFNENRALFEVVLAADHGSVTSYKSDSDGCSRPIHGEFQEKEMLASAVFPVQRQLFRHYEHSILAITTAEKRYSPSFEQVVRAHARMVFNPTKSEKEWFSSVFHVENYGVFERSSFGVPEKPPRLVKRLQFLIQIFRQRNVSSLGFWPWLTLYARGGSLSALIYAVIRRLQK
jgi:hypothetical protein